MSTDVEPTTTATGPSPPSALSQEDRAYISEHQLESLMQAIMKALLRSKPRQPLKFLAQKLARKAEAAGHQDQSGSASTQRATRQHRKGPAPSAVLIDPRASRQSMVDGGNALGDRLQGDELPGSFQLEDEFPSLSMKIKQQRQQQHSSHADALEGEAEDADRVGDGDEEEDDSRGSGKGITGHGLYPAPARPLKTRAADVLADLEADEAYDGSDSSDRSIGGRGASAVFCARCKRIIQSANRNHGSGTTGDPAQSVARASRYHGAWAMMGDDDDDDAGENLLLSRADISRTRGVGSTALRSRVIGGGDEIGVEADAVDGDDERGEDAGVSVTDLLSTKRRYGNLGKSLHRAHEATLHADKDALVGHEGGDQGDDADDDDDDDDVDYLDAESVAGLHMSTSVRPSRDAFGSTVASLDVSAWKTAGKSSAAKRLSTIGGGYTNDGDYDDDAMSVATGVDVDDELDTFFRTARS